MTRTLRLLALLVLLPADLFAGGSEFNSRAADLVLTIDTRWAGCNHGGYYPIRIMLTNNGPTRDLRFSFGSEYNNVPHVIREFRSEQNSTTQFTLSVPVVNREDNGGELTVFADGRQIDALTTGLDLPTSHPQSRERPALLVIDPVLVSMDAFESAVNYELHRTSPSHSGYGYYGGHNTSNSQVIPPANLPDKWIDYSGLDLVAISLKSLEGLPETKRSAIFGWAQTGGTLIIYDVGGPAENSEPLNRLLKVPVNQPEEWQGARPQRVQIQLIDLEGGNQFGGHLAHGHMGPGVAVPAEQPEAAAPALPEWAQGFAWEDSPRTFVHRPLMFGQVYAFQKNPFPGSNHDWHWFLQDAGQQNVYWSKRNGLSARQDTPDFLRFLDPSVQGVPVYSFIFLITLFTLIIGPLNYWYLSKRKQLYLLVLTIPVLACVTSLFLFAYSAVSQGFGVKSRTRSFTLLDQPNNTAISLARISLYAGMAPSNGLNFSPETAVFPIWPTDAGFESGTVDWTESQRLTAGWLRSRTRTQFYTIQQRNERGRLTLTPAEGGTLKAENGFEYDLEQVLVVDENNVTYYGADIAAGQPAILHPAREEELTAFREQAREHGLKEPDFDLDSSMGLMSGPYRYYGYYDRLMTSMAQGKLEQMVEQTTQFDVGRLPRKPVYLGLFRTNPGIDLGVPKSTPTEDRHVIMGFY